MNINYYQLVELVEEIYPEVLKIRRNIHQNPELSEHEVNTAKLICETLSFLNIQYRNGVAGYGVYAVIEGADNKEAIGIRADMDALPIGEETSLEFKSCVPGVMHACGHDIHTSTLLGTAIALSRLKEILPQSVALFFEPAEETRGGAKYMIDEGCLENPKVDKVIGLHIDPTLESGKIEFIKGTMNAASTEFQVTVKGKSCHGASPYLGTDPLIPACNMVTAIQSIITRKITPTDTALITVGMFHSGTAGNIIPDETKFKGIIRVLEMENREKIKMQLETLCNNIAKSYGATCVVDFKDSYPTLVNDDELHEKVSSECMRLLGTEKVNLGFRSSLGADDFAYFCHSAKGLYFNLGTTPKGQEIIPLHSAKLNPDENSMKTGMLAELIAVLTLSGVEIEK